ncbi:MAG: hypothetical protein AABY87_08430 [bacterium]
MKMYFKFLSVSAIMILMISGYLFADTGGAKMQEAAAGKDASGKEPMSSPSPAPETKAQGTISQQERLQMMERMMKDPAMHSELIQRIMGNEGMMNEMIGRMVFQAELMNRMMDRMMTNMGTRNMIVDRVMQDAEMRNRIIKDGQSSKKPKAQSQHPVQPQTKSQGGN